MIGKKHTDNNRPNLTDTSSVRFAAKECSYYILMQWSLKSWWLHCWQKHSVLRHIFDTSEQQSVLMSVRLSLCLYAHISRTGEGIFTKLRAKECYEKCEAVYIFINSRKLINHLTWRHTDTLFNLPYT